MQKKVELAQLFASRFVQGFAVFSMVSDPCGRCARTDVRNGGKLPKHSRRVLVVTRAGFIHKLSCKAAIGKIVSS